MWSKAELFLTIFFLKQNVTCNATNISEPQAHFPHSMKNSFAGNNVELSSFKHLTNVPIQSIQLEKIAVD